MPEKAQINSATFSSFAGQITSNEEMAWGAIEMKGVQKGKLRETPGQVLRRSVSSRGRAKPPCTNPPSSWCVGARGTGGDGVVPEGLLRPGRSLWFKRRGRCRWLLAGDRCGSLALPSGPSGHQCVADEFGSHPSVSSRQRVIREPKIHLLN